MKDYKTPVLGDPYVNNSEHIIPICWFDRVLNDQLRISNEYSLQTQNLNAGKGWEEHIQDFSEKYHAPCLDFRWWEYEGKHRERGKKAPLIVMLIENWNTTWQHIADNNDLVLIQFEYHRTALYEPCIDSFARDEELDAYVEIIDGICEKYNVDRERMYIVGLSCGDLTANNWVARYPKMFAGLACLNGPMSAEKNRRHPQPEDQDIPTLQLRGDEDWLHDGFIDGFDYNLGGNRDWFKYTKVRLVGTIRKYWMNLYQTERKPKIATNGRRTFLLYDEGKAPFIYCEAEGNGHIPPVDFGQVCWDNLFNVYKRNADEKIETIGERDLKPDQGAIAVMLGKDKAYIDHEVVPLSGPCKLMKEAENTPFWQYMYGGTDVKGDTLYAPIDLLEKGFNINYEVTDLDNYSCCDSFGFDADYNDLKGIILDDKRIDFKKNGTCYELFTNCSFVQKNGKSLPLGRPVLVLENGTIMIPVQEIAALFGFKSSMNNGMVYICDHEITLGFTTPVILREEILEDEHEKYYTPVVRESYRCQVKLSTDRIKEGENLEITVIPDEGYYVEQIKVYLRGIVPPVERIEETKLMVYNVVGDLDIVAACGPDDKRRLAESHGETKANFSDGDPWVQFFEGNV